MSTNNDLYTFDDILLVPQYSDICSRSSVDVSTQLTKNIRLEIPIISSNMDTITELKMAYAMNSLGGLGVIHRYLPKTKIVSIVAVLNGLGVYNIAASIGIKENQTDLAYVLKDFGCNIIFVDVAHGHHSGVIDTVKYLKDMLNVKLYGNIQIIAGNVVTRKAAMDLIDAGADGIKVGVGPGSVCTTRTITGHGYPQLSAIADIYQEIKETGIPIIADGGIRNSGDIVKALAFGASSVMCGNLFSGTDETPGKVRRNLFGKKISKTYRGMASKEAKESFFGNFVDASEGVKTEVPYKGSVVNVVNNLVAGIRSGISYSGARNIKELREKFQYIKVTNSTKLEALTINNV